MKQYEVELLPSAWQDFDYISDYLIAKSINAARRIIEALLKAMRGLSVMPEAYPRR